MNINHLIIGISEDGPDGQIYKPTDIVDSKETYGWWNRSWNNLTSISSSITLGYNVWDDRFLIYKTYSNKLISAPLFNPSVSGNILTFGAPGSSGLYLVKYAKEPITNDLIFSYITSVLQGSNCWVCRYPGVKSNIILGDLTLEARNSGGVFNNVTVSTTGSTVKIYWNRENTATTCYTYSSSSTTLAQDINQDFYYQKHPFKAKCYSTSPTIPTGNYLTSGGTTGTYTSSGFLSLLDTLDLENVGVLQIAGGCELSVYTTILDYLSDNNIENIVVISGTPVSYIDTYTSDDYIDYIQGLTETSKQGIYVTGWGQTRNNPEISSGWTSLCDILPSVLVTNNTPVNKRTLLTDYTPEWSKEQLDVLKSNYSVFNRFIGSGISCYSSNNLFGNDVLFVKSKLEVLSLLVDILDKYVGNNLINYQLLNKEVEEALSKMTNVKDLGFTIEVLKDLITINISYGIYGQIEDINLSLSTRNSTSV